MIAFNEKKESLRKRPYTWMEIRKHWPPGTTVTQAFKTTTKACIDMGLISFARPKTDHEIDILQYNSRPCIIKARAKRKK